MFTTDTLKEAYPLNVAVNVQKKVFQATITNSIRHIFDESKHWKPIHVLTGIVVIDMRWKTQTRFPSRMQLSGVIIFEQIKRFVYKVC